MKLLILYYLSLYKCSWPIISKFNQQFLLNLNSRTDWWRVNTSWRSQGSTRCSSLEQHTNSLMKIFLIFIEMFGFFILDFSTNFILNKMNELSEESSTKTRIMSDSWIFFFFSMCQKSPFHLSPCKSTNIPVETNY